MLEAPDWAGWMKNEGVYLLYKREPHVNPKSSAQQSVRFAAKSIASHASNVAMSLGDEAA